MGSMMCEGKGEGFSMFGVVILIYVGGGLYGEVKQWEWEGWDVELNGPSTY